MPDTVRIATRADEPEIIRLLHMMHAEGGMFTLDETRMREHFDIAYNRKGGIIGVIGPSTNILAAIFLLIHKQWYTTQDHLEDIFNFVRPDSRQSNHADTLIAFAKKCSDDIGIPLMLGVFTNKRTEAKVRLYRRSLGVPVGAIFVHNATWVNETESATGIEFWNEAFREKSGSERVSKRSRRRHNAKRREHWEQKVAAGRTE